MLKRDAIIMCSFFTNIALAQLENKLYILQKNLTSLSSMLTRSKIGGKVYSISSLDELNKYIKEHDRIILDIYKVMCGPCQAFTPVYEEFAQKHPDIICLKVEGDEAPDIEDLYEVSGWPTIVLYKNKTKFDQSTGASRTFDQFESRIKKFLK